MKIIFWGTPPYAVPILNAIKNSNHEILAIVTQPDKRRSRGKKLSASAVKQRAQELGIKTFTPSNIKTQTDIQQELANIQADIYIVVAFGQILPLSVLNYPPYGCWNIHASLLPNWRGAAPIQWSLISGDKYTGVAIMAMEEGLDTGPILNQQKLEIGITENAEELSNRLSKLSSQLIIESLHKIQLGGIGSASERYQRLNLIKQEDLKGSIRYARQICKDDYHIDWNDTAIKIHRKIMGLYPHAFTIWKGKRIKLLNCTPIEESFRKHFKGKDIKGLQSNKNAPGQIIEIIKDTGLVVSTGDSGILITEAQIEGKKVSSNSVLLQQLKASINEKFDKLTVCSLN